jgi:ribonuclease HI
MGQYRGWSSSNFNLTPKINLRYAASLQFTSEIDKCTKKNTKYEANLLGLQKLRATGVQTYVLHTDSNVVSQQIKKNA